MGNALISRSNQRFERLRDTSPVMQAAALPSLTGFLDLDVAIERLQPGMRVPVSIGSTWVDQIGWGLDSVAISTRFLLCAQMVGACVVARTQLERWSTNLAANHGAPQRSGESTADWLDRIWSIEGAQRLLTWRSEESTDHPVAGLLARQIDARSCYLAMSELLHGSGPLMDVLWWESVEVTEPLRAELVGALDTITDALLLCVHRAQAGLATAAEDACNDELASKIWQTPIAGPLHGQIMKLEPYLWPVDLMMLRDRNLLHSLGAPGAHYRNEVARACRGSTTAIRDELGPALAFADRRTRALALATAAFKFEQEQVGDDFDEEALAQLTVDAVLASEMSAVLALWLKEGGQQEVASAFATCSGALRSAVWLWLEDDDRAMGCLRVLIEQVARARTWRMKPQSAIKLEARSETTPRDWIEKCGWRRLGVLLKSLGEFVHGANPNHWATARDVLVSLNPNPDRDVAKMSGRTNCLADLIVVLDGECADWLALIDSELANAFWEVAGLTRENFDTGMESNMQRAWLHRHLHTRKHG